MSLATEPQADDICVAIYENVTSTKAIVRTQSWEKFSQNMRRVSISDTKEVCLFGPHKIGGNGSRKNDNITEITAFVFDIDNAPGHTCASILGLVSNYAAIAHTTWSHSPEEPRFRLVLQLRNPIAVADFHAVRDAFLAAHPGLAAIIDKVCKDFARFYYLYSYPEERVGFSEFMVNEGEPIDPKAFLPLTTPAPSQVASAMHLSIPGIQLIRPRSEATRNILQAPEAPEEIDKLRDALAKLSPDTARGSGRFYAHDGKPEDDYWMAVIWAIASLQWARGKELAREWSKGSHRYTEEGFEHAWSQFNPNHPSHIGIGSLYKRASEMGAVISVSAPTLTKSKFTLLSVHELNQIPAIEWLIKGILPNKGLAAVFGPSGSGKTFLALDMIMSIAAKPEWFGLKVNNVPVVYAGLEGAGGIRNRVNAWKAHHQVSELSNFKLILGDFDLMSRSQVEGLAAAVIAEGMGDGIIVIDTLNQASPTADENASKDMGVIIQHLKLLQELTGGLVIIVHHTGKNTHAGLRGHSSLKAALDTSIEVEGEGGRRTWTLNKSKDGVAGKFYAFNLSVEQLGLDADGDPVTSCVVEYNSSVVVQRPGPTGSAQKAAYQRIKANLENSADLNKCSSGIGVKRISVEAAIADLASTLSTTSSNKRSNRARSIVTSLITGGHLKTELAGDEGWVWLS